jgi:CheY-like chemotaxis protein
MNDPKERREHERIPFREDIIVDGVMKATSVDISEGGLYICTVQPFAEDTVIEVTIPFRGKSLTVKARVQYSQVGIGMGVRFVNISDEQRQKLKELTGAIATVPARHREKEYRILFIEENDISRQYESKLLAEGFYVIGAKDVIEAMRILREQTPDLIIIDLYMKKMDGFKVLSILKTTPKWKELPVIVCSTSATEDVMKKVIDAGADEFLNKIVTPASQLVDIVRSVLRKGH